MPYSAKNLLKEIFIISEYPDGTEPQKGQFVARDKI